ncbi:predicted protein [Naegleria gruberi]|uniref:Predicted protein n=1 Tax=Naegleria gruberi TaxID=5762 RepID=D2VRF2_NAEGR|nr:uncharacterized protein NAEGRDRAFT_71564 [Naegleria gruberi]EFC40597.1 predicted protein [Naegleria gruberi]|eukprot:XP_002673341.1 predicted protein [Naegleria gruberi strain NEG-M]
MFTNDLLFVALCLVFALYVGQFVHVTNGQNCSASSLVSNFAIDQAANVQCQIGYAPDKLSLQCRPYDTVFDENYGKLCNVSSDCQLSFVCSELSKICVPSKTRRLGDACLARESCVEPFNCFNGVCSIVKESSDRKFGEKCNFIDYANNTKHLCNPTFACLAVSYPIYHCFERIESDIGGFCGQNSTSFQSGSCKVGMCNAITEQCVPYLTNATEGQGCEIMTPNSYTTCGSNYECRLGTCYLKVDAGLDETCLYYNSTSYTFGVCREKLTCSGGKCIGLTISPLGGYCGQNSTGRYNCGNGYCFLEKCVPYVSSLIGGKCDVTDSEGFFTCKNDGTSPYCFNNICRTRGKLGESCQHKSDSCTSQLICRSIGGAPKTCENYAQKNENCSSTSDCATGLLCLYSKCTNLNGKSVGEACFSNSECDSGLCYNSICSLNYNTSSCSTDSDCNIYENSKCSCGSGRSSSDSTFGTCAGLKRCNVYQLILEICLSNYGRGASVTTIFDRHSSIHKDCAKEFSQYYSCLRIGISEAGNVQSLSISGLDVNTQVKDPAVVKIAQCNAFLSHHLSVCSGFGDCIADGVCKCYPGYTGTYCQTIYTPQKSSIIPPTNSIGGENRTALLSEGKKNTYSNLLWIVLISLIFIPH